jgi:SAM-dependent methyltransferase
MKWQIELLKASLSGLLPFQEALRRIKRKIKPYSSSPTTKKWTIEQGITQIQLLEKAGFSICGKIALELGTGWEPFIPFIFHLAGCKKIILIDAHHLIERETIISTINDLIKYSNLISNALKIDNNEIVNKLQIPATCNIDDIFRRFNFTYMAPSDARTTNLPDCSIDLITSRAVLEFIPPLILNQIFIEFNRILKVEGKMCHVIDNSDHWEHYDKGISRLNFLKFNDFIWKFTSINPLVYLNRLRHYEYLEMLDKTGFKIDYDDSNLDEKALTDLKHLKICKKYRNSPHKKLAILTSYIVASKKGNLCQK